MKYYLLILVGWSVLWRASAIVNCVCNNSTVSTTVALVCASDGRTYLNAQWVGCFNTCYQTKLTILAYGACGATTTTTTTTTAASVTLPPFYPNFPGRCYCPNSGAYSPVCASDGRTYASAELLACYNRCHNMNLVVVQQGYCPKNLCICTNSNYYSPVCGSDGRTYKNPKVVECLNVCQNRNIAIVKYQAC